MSAYASRIGILIASWFILSCVPPHITTESSSDVVPSVSSQKNLLSIVRRQYPSDRYLVGVGEGGSEKAATELARADLMKQIRVEVSVTWTDFLRERDGKSEQEVSRQVETRVMELASGVEIVDQRRDAATGLAYAVAVLPKAEVTRLLRGAQEQREATPPTQQIPDRKDGVWVTAEGTVSLGDETTLAEAKARSRDEARRKAIEQAVGTFVTGQTVVYNAQVADDLVRSLVRGIIVEEQILDEGIRQLATDSPGPKALRYATKLRAKVKPVRMEHRGDFAVRAALNKTVFHEGEEMQIRAVTPRDAYLHIFSVGQDDTVTVLLPSRYARANFLASQKEFVFPDDEQRSMGIRLRVFPPAGATRALENIKLIATTKPIDLAQGKIQEGMFQVYPAKDATLVTNLLKTLSLLDESEWAEVTVPYEVRRLGDHKIP